MNNIEILEKLVERCKECKFACCEQCEINWKEVQAIENLLENSKKIIELNYIPKSKIKEKIEYYHHKDFIKVQVCYQHDNEARIKEEALRELLEEGE